MSHSWLLGEFASEPDRLESEVVTMAGPAA